MARSRSQQRQQQEVLAEGYASTEGVGFSDGTMIVDGQPQRPERVEIWLSSNELSQYVTIEWVDPSTGVKRCSCNCLGWGVKRGGGERSCCHTKDMMGIEPCTKRRRVENRIIHNFTEAVAAIPDMHEGRELRAIMLDDDE